MFKRFTASLALLLTILNISLLADVRKNMDLLFGYHVEFNEMNPLLIQRSFKNFIEQFDPERIYLLDREVDAYFRLTDPQVEKVLGGYDSDNFFEYSVLHQRIKKSIERARRVRDEVSKELIINGKGIPSYVGETYLTYAKNAEALRERIRRRLIRVLSQEQPHFTKAQWTPEVRERILAIWCAKAKRQEAVYLESDEKVFSLKLLKALSKSLDSHTAFYSEEEALVTRARLEKAFEGIGVMFREGIYGIHVSGIVRGGPADKTKKMAIGDLLTHINGLSVVGMSYDDALKLLKVKGDLKLAFKTDQNQEYSVKLRRERIVFGEERVRYEIEPCKGGLIGRITLPSFYESDGGRSSADRDMRAAVEALKRAGNLQGLVLDLRENSGGFLKQAVKVAGLFIDRGIIVVSKYGGGHVKTLRDQDGRSVYHGPLIVLTSKASASAAEIVAGALKDHGAALIVGDNHTYGKGTIQFQTLTDPNAEVFFKVTVGRYYTASGRSTQIHGIVPDIHLPSRFAGYKIGERFLEYPLTSDNIPSVLDERPESHVADGGNWLAREYDFHWRESSPKLEALLARLRASSEERQKAYEPYRKYLEQLERQKGKRFSLSPVPAPESVDADFQLCEAVRILEDIING